MQTLYKEPSPSKFENGEFYQLHIDVEVVNGQPVLFVREKHGWFANDEKRAVHVTTTLSPEDGFALQKDAQAMYDQQLRRRVSEGFKYSFSFDPYSDTGYRYEELA